MLLRKPQGFVDDLKLLQVSFEETPTARWFPELGQLPSSVTYLDMRVVGDQRLTALGFQGGQLMCAITNIISCGQQQHLSTGSDALN